MATFCDGIVQNIDRTECIGNSLVKINNNFTGLESAGCVLENTVDGLSTNLTTLSTNFVNLSSAVAAATLFVPVNLQTRSNQNVVLASQSWTGVTSSANQPWWSGVQTTNLSSVPSNAVAASIEIYHNINSVANHGQAFYLRKDSTENWSAPSNSSTSGTITLAQYNAISSNYLKMVQDPTGESAGLYEAEMTTVIPIYFNTSTKTFQWFITDSKTGAITTNPSYYVRIKLLGYYVTV